MNAENNIRQAYVARHPFLPGAFAYLNAKHVEDRRGVHILERWIEQGAIVAKVSLDQAVRELHEHIAARRAPPEDLPVFFRKQAD
jgi:hypothetical protein